MTHEDNTTSAPPRPIRVGLIGAGDWALHGHVRVLNLLAAYEPVAVQARRREAAEQAARDHGFRYVVDTVDELVNHPEVDLVVVTTPTPQHADSVRAALAASKDVYSEWPLTTTVETDRELIALAEISGTRHVVGLQRRLAPHNRYLKDLLADGFVGGLLSVRVHVSIPYLGDRRPAAHWTSSAENFAHVVSIYGGHFLDMVFTATGWPDSISAVQLNQFPVVTLEDTGEQVEATSPDQLVLIGQIGERTALTAQIEGGKHHGNGVQIDITGDDGDLRITNRSAFGGVGDDYLIQGARRHDRSLKVMPVPADYDTLPESDLPSAVLELGQLYNTHAHDVADNTHTAPTFADAVRLHRLFDAAVVSSSTGRRVNL